MIDDDRFNPFWAEMSRLRIPHIFVVGFLPKKEYLDSLEPLERVLKKFPDLNAITGHLGCNIKSVQ